LLTVFGTVGGIQTLLIAVLGYLGSFCIDKHYIAALARKFYLLRGRPDITAIRRAAKEQGGCC